jgi:hypothetical protein
VDFAEHVGFPHPAGNKLRVLGTEIENDDHGRSRTELEMGFKKRGKAPSWRPSTAKSTE